MVGGTDHGKRARWEDRTRTTGDTNAVDRALSETDASETDASEVEGHFP